MNRRQNLQSLLQTVLAASAWPALGSYAQSTPDAAALLRSGGCVLMLRHAQTEPGIGDPPNFQLGQCSTQRNLSDEGTAQSQRIGQWFTARKLAASSVQSSAWCRCKDTAQLAFGRFDVLPALNSTFENRSSQEAQTELLRERLKRIRASQFEVWVTHQVNISALTGEGVAMGEALVVKLGSGNSPGQMLARVIFS